MPEEDLTKALDLALARFGAHSEETARLYAESSVRLAIATENFTREVREWREAAAAHNADCRKCQETLAALSDRFGGFNALLTESLKSRQEVRSWWKEVIIPLIATILGALAAFWGMKGK